MSDSEPDLELLELLRQHLGVSPRPGAPPTTNVLRDAEFIADNSVDVAIDMTGTKAVAAKVYRALQGRPLPDQSGWAANGLHPTVANVGKGAAVVVVAKAEEEHVAGDGEVTMEDRAVVVTEEAEADVETNVEVDGATKVLEFVFTMDLLNFCFWSEKDEESRFAVQYQGKRWTGYWSLIAALRRALDDGIAITSPAFWHGGEFTLEVLRNVFRSATAEEIPLLEERYKILKESAEVLCKVRNFDLCYRSLLTVYQEFELDVTQIISQTNGSAAALVNLLAEKFPAFRDEAKFERKKVRFLKRAQIFVADVWSAFGGEGYGKFNDIDHLTMFPGIAPKLVLVIASNLVNQTIVYHSN
jgi:hypothetical protein